MMAMLLAFAMVAAACGSDSDDGDTAADTTAEEPAAEEPAAEEPAAEEPAAEEPAAEEEAMAEFESSPGIDAENMVIRVGLNTDLSGAFAPLTTKITDGHLAFWEEVNANGGIAGWTIEPIVIDNAYDVPTHLENYESFRSDGDEGVAMLSTSTGSPHTASIARDAIDDGMAIIPLSWYSGWGDPGIGANVFEVQTNYCVEAMNAVTYLSETFGNKMAIAGFPGDYGEDGSLGAKYAAEQLGLEIVFDGQGQVVPGADQTPVITGIAESGADFTWLTTNPSTAAELIGGAAQAGYTGQWSGNSPTYNPALLGTALGPVLDTSYTHSTYSELWGTTDDEGMQNMIEVMQARRPDAPFDDVYIISWIEGYVASQAIEQAISNGDLSRQGIVDALNEITADLKGLAPDQSWAGDPNTNVVRESYLYDITLADYTPGATVTTEGASNGYSKLEGPYVSPTAEAWTYEPCFKADF
jgi:ABC-type branched-subunit amino acid transport system substrate-binding protein